MHNIKEEMRTSSKSGKAALLFLVYAGHGILSPNGEIFAVMPNGTSFVNLSNFAECCALKNQLVMVVCDCELKETQQSANLAPKMDLNVEG
jgi:hypothetical protein